jgi:hypothetical protein
VPLRYYDIYHWFRLLKIYGGINSMVTSLANIHFYEIRKVGWKGASAVKEAEILIEL